MEVTDNPGGIAAISPSGAAPQRNVSLFEQININAFWIANNFHWQALLAIVIPSMVVKFLGDANKDVNLALVVIWGTLVAVVVNPLIGAISDYATFRMGRRRPFLIAGTVFNVVVLVLFAFAPRWFSSTALLITFIILFLLLQFTNNIANSPWSAIIADNVPEHHVVSLPGSLVSLRYLVRFSGRWLLASSSTRMIRFRSIRMRSCGFFC